MDEEAAEAGPSVFKVKEKGAAGEGGKAGGKRGRRSGKEKYQLSNAGYDSDSVDLDMLATYNRKTFGKKSQHADSSTEDETSFMALLNKPLVNHPSTEMKNLVGEEKCEADLEKDDQV